ncbi:putative methyltransferase DDB_G0268948 [Betta splendens]|uniref:Methyltransferase DDB_G0268948 n=1 Tax=Betta splendens TaxID=158456 RepID=A0A6P7LGB7_BETSP|nr:putative methyltransferase DDB_G0268948 [Betta splendens]
MANRLFESREHAADYWKYRLCPSDRLIQRMIDFLDTRKGRPFDLALDVGCGSGQGSVLLAKHFTSVVATDVSRAQLEEALLHANRPNITYKQCAAEELPLDDGSVDLVAAMSAFHWFDRPRFLREAHRVLKPRGCLALLNYTIDMELSHPGCCPAALNRACKEFYEALHPYRSPCLGPSSMDFYREASQSIPYPDKEWQECVWVKQSMPLSSFIGLLQSFSHYQILLREDPQKADGLSQAFCERLMSIMRVTSAETEVEVAVKYYYLLACKPQDV